MLQVVIAAVLSLLYTGIGQIYNRQRIKGIIFIVLQLIATATKMYTNGIPVFVLYLIGILDAVVYGIKIHRDPDRDVIRGKQWVEVVVALLIAWVLATGANEISKKEIVITPVKEPSKAEMKQFESDVLHYLEDKYGEKFVIQGSKYTGQSDRYSALVFPSKNKNLIFVVDRTGKGALSDTYPATVWSEQAKKETEPVVKQAFPKHAVFYCTVGVDSDTVSQIRGPVPSYSKWRKEFPDKYSQEIQLFVIQDITPQNRQQVLNDVYQIIHFLNSKGIVASIEIQFFDEKLLTKGVDQVTFGTQGDYFAHLQYMIDLTVGELKQIQSPQDLEKYLRKIPHN